jgi:hypothetical protein
MTSLPLASPHTPTCLAPHAPSLIRKQIISALGGKWYLLTRRRSSKPADGRFRSAVSPSPTPCPRTAATAHHRPRRAAFARPPLPPRLGTVQPPPMAWGRRRATSASLLGFVRPYDFFGERTVRSHLGGLAHTGPLRAHSGRSPCSRLFPKAVIRSARGLSLTVISPVRRAALVTQCRHEDVCSRHLGRAGAGTRKCKRLAPINLLPRRRRPAIRRRSRRWIYWRARMKATSRRASAGVWGQNRARAYRVATAVPRTAPRLERLALVRGGSGVRPF